MQQSRAEKFVAKALMTILIAAVLWFLLKPEHRPRRSSQHETVTAEIETAKSDSEDSLASSPPLAPNSSSSSPQIPPPPTATPAPGQLSAEEIATRRSSIKAALSAIYSSNASFYAEYKRYTTDLAAAGYMPTEGVLPAKFGFLTPYEPRGGREDNENPKRISSDIFLNLQDEDGEPLYKYDVHTKDVDLSKFSHFCRDGCTASDTRFEVMAAVNLDEDDTLDIWIIDTDKEIRHVVDDTKE